MVRGSESHRSARYRIDLPVFCTYTLKTAPDPGVGLGWARNLSEWGACLELVEALAHGTPLHLALQIGDDPLTVEATVIWVRHPGLAGGHTLHGVHFPGILPEQQEALHTLLRRTGPRRSRLHRLPAALPVQCRVLGAPGPSVCGWTGDLGEQGGSLLLPDRLPAGTLLEATLTAPSGDLVAEALVVWVAPAERVRPGHLTRHGVRFTDPTVLRGLMTSFVREKPRSEGERHASASGMP